MTRETSINVIVAGLGGQGVLTCSDLLADAAFRAGWSVKKAEIHGMSQRGGSVSCDVRFGSKVLSPMVPEGEADFLVVLEATQEDPHRHILKPDGTLLSVSQMDVGALPSKKTLNTAMLGMLSHHLPEIPDDCWQSALKAAFPQKILAMNHDAFAIGQACAGGGKGVPVKPK